MARLTVFAAVAWLAAIAAAWAHQDEPPTEDPAQLPPAEDLTQPPRISDDVAPGDARLEPPPEEGEDMLTVVVTSGQTEFNLPDLGTGLRREREARDPNRRFEVTFLYLYDPDNMDPAEEAFPSLEEKLGVGMLRIFQIPLGGNRERERD